MTDNKSTYFKKLLFGEIYDLYFSNTENPILEYKNINQQYNRFCKKIATYLSRRKKYCNLITNNGLDQENASIRFLLHYVMNVYVDSLSNDDAKWGKKNKIQTSNKLIDNNVSKDIDYRTFTNFISKRLDNTILKTIAKEQEIQECLYYISYAQDSNFMKEIPYKLTEDSLKEISLLTSDITDSTTPQNIFDDFTDILLTNLLPDKKEKFKEENVTQSYIVFSSKTTFPNEPIDKIFLTKQLIDKFK